MFSGADVKLLNVKAGGKYTERQSCSCAHHDFMFRSEGVSPLILNLGTKSGTLLRGKRVRKLLNKRKSRLYVLAKRKICCSC